MTINSLLLVLKWLSVEYTPCINSINKKTEYNFKHLFNSRAFHHVQNQFNSLFMTIFNINLTRF